MRAQPTNTELSELYQRFAPIILRQSLAILGNEGLA